MTSETQQLHTWIPRQNSRPVIRRNTLEEMRGLAWSRGPFVGSAVVAGASYGEQSTTLELKTFAGENFDFTVPAIPDHAGAAAFYQSSLRPISVKIRQGGEHCTAIALSIEGPRSSSVSLSTALALLHRGVHTVVEGGLHSDVVCSANMHEHEVPC
ncbi:hypothetical protein [Paenarthrobacter sp. A20]|uniref:hypothetical protein n=1 Tax=Paenarthrobacter sp. A20 TaxID=2817891 RepID=UPI00209ED4F3|nr:hypothetical protein [Paenarthrobacter sp. A20]MCP1415555.1 hypothetical protein [Paenarthrobacter sp. A20]